MSWILTDAIMPACIVFFSAVAVAMALFSDMTPLLSLFPLILFSRRFSLSGRSITRFSDIVLFIRKNE